MRVVSLARYEPLDFSPPRLCGSSEGRSIAAPTATEPMTARDIAERALVAANIRRPDKAALADLTGSILASLRNHTGKGIQRTNEGAPARWRLKEAAT
jgi:hypothetical protein